jgi:putative ABC transport system permease protein
VTGLAGPFAATTLNPDFQGQPWGTLGLAGRASPGGTVDDVVLSSGHWAEGHGQVVLNSGSDSGFTYCNGSTCTSGASLGSTFTVTSLPGKPVLTVVGFANSVTNTADGW